MSKVEKFIFNGTPQSAVSIDSGVRNWKSGQFLQESTPLCLTFSCVYIFADFFSFDEICVTKQDGDYQVEEFYFRFAYIEWCSIRT